jgi:hypothetical protein
MASGKGSFIELAQRSPEHDHRSRVVPADRERISNGDSPLFRFARIDAQ